MGKYYPDVNPGEIVPGGFTYPNNAKLQGDFLYLRDSNKNMVSGRQVDDGDSITVLDVGYSQQLALVQYPTSAGVRQGYVNNTPSVIKYNNANAWANGSTIEIVYDENGGQLGSLDPYEKATPLYKKDGMTHVVYNTDKGSNTKSGYVKYEGTGGGSTSPGGEIKPGELVPGGFTYPNNAKLQGDFLYLRDENKNMVSGRQVDNGDSITVLDVGYTKQLALVQYPTSAGVRQGYVNNTLSVIKYNDANAWANGSTTEIVYDENGGQLGSLSPYESATPLYKKNGMTHVVYNTDKGPNTKSGYVKYEGGSVTKITIPKPSTLGVSTISYGKSGKERDLTAYKIGNGNNSLVMVCEVHGFEDNFPKDGLELVNIGNDLIRSLASNGTKGWSVYVIPAANPDGLAEGYTNNGPGRCTIVGGVDINRDFPIGFTSHGTPRYWTGDKPLSVNESSKLSEFIQGIKNKTSGKMVVIDLHGWEGAAIGNPEIGQYFRNQFGFEQRSGYGADRGFLIAWAKSIGADAALIELPRNTHSHSDVINGGYSQKVINAVNGILSNNPVGPTVLKEGSSGDAVKKLQEDLQKLGFFEGGCSGYYDSLTAFSVKQFQLKYNIIGEGDVAGYKTLFTLRDLLTPVEITDKLKSLMQLYEKEFVKARITDVDILQRLYIFYNLVKNRGPADLKNLPEWRHYQFIFENEVIDNDAPGNILYGYVGKVFGFQDITLLSGAGFAQWRAGTSKSEWVNIESWGDDPRDQARIKQGINIYRDLH